MILKAQAGDRDAQDAIVRKYEGLCLSLARKQFAFSEEDREDFVQIARIAVLRAAMRFDVSRDVRFMTYAHRVIRNRLASAKGKVGGVIDLPFDFTGPKYAKHREKAARALVPISIHSIRSGDDREFLESLADTSAADPLDAEADDTTQKQRGLIDLALQSLEDRERDFLLRYLNSETYEQIGDYHGLTKERVRQIIDSALADIRRHIGARSVQAPRAADWKEKAAFAVRRLKRANH